MTKNSDSEQKKNRCANQTKKHFFASAKKRVAMAKAPKFTYLNLLYCFLFLKKNSCLTYKLTNLPFFSSKKMWQLFPYVCVGGGGHFIFFSSHKKVPVFFLVPVKCSSAVFFSVLGQTSPSVLCFFFLDPYHSFMSNRIISRYFTMRFLVAGFLSIQICLFPEFQIPFLEEHARVTRTQCPTTPYPSPKEMFFIRWKILWTYLPLLENKKIICFISKRKIKPNGSFKIQSWNSLPNRVAFTM